MRDEGAGLAEPKSRAGPILSCHGFDVAGLETLPADRPVPLLVFLDAYPGDPAKSLAFDRNHCLGDLLDQLLFLRGRKDVLDDFDVDQWHDAYFLVAGTARSFASPERRFMLEDGVVMLEDGVEIFRRFRAVIQGDTITP